MLVGIRGHNEDGGAAGPSFELLKHVDTRGSRHSDVCQNAPDGFILVAL